MLSVSFYWPLGHKVLFSVGREQNVYCNYCIWFLWECIFNNWSLKNLVEVCGYGLQMEESWEKR